eukprot:CAMPEP_0179339266 /NCGR_PEP_ID=MMETSP0797-20121207/68618_1 /TAXON_ID=47934 /ORGANISM="Dinophysis acuminata, Strain DAEP01" /LENGTH=68 /DNA_ID=CAMNT_0021053075 /DNA_START=9 /DNA_END=211 /DNA_ORIENTATION=-
MVDFQSRMSARSSESMRVFMRDMPVDTESSVIDVFRLPSMLERSGLDAVRVTPSRAGTSCSAAHRETS